MAKPEWKAAIGIFLPLLERMIYISQGGGARVLILSHHIRCAKSFLQPVSSFVKSEKLDRNIGYCTHMLPP